MSRWKIIEDINYYFITTTIVEWQNVFVFDELFEVIIASLKYCIDHKGLHLHAYVIMPNHVHYIVSVDSAQHLSDIIRDLNRFTSRQITHILKKTMRTDLLDVFQKAAIEEGRGNIYKVWLEGYHPIAIYSEDFFLQKLKYMHENPVRKKLADQPENWKYSSARNYYLDDHSIIQVECFEY